MPSRSTPDATAPDLVCTGALMDPDELAALGLYDPDAEHAGLQLELLQYLAGLGATGEELVAWRHGLAGLALVLAVRGGAAMTIDEAVERSGLSEEQIRRINRAAGLVDPAPGARIFTDGFVALASALPAVATVFGEDALYQLVRVLGSAMERVADAVVSLFLVNVEPAARREDPVGLAVARANTEAAALVPLLAPTLDVLFRQHLLAAQRTALSDDQTVGYETQRLVVGFVEHRRVDRARRAAEHGRARCPAHAVRAPRHRHRHQRRGTARQVHRR